MTGPSRQGAERERLPRPAQWLLRLSPVPRQTRAEVQGDLLELFTERRRNRGAAHAHWRLYHDIASLFLEPRSVARMLPAGGGNPAPVMRAGGSRAALGLLLDARADLKYAVRLFARQPAILMLAIVGLSLGLGIATAAFSIMNAAALRGAGLVDPDRAPGVLRTTDRSVSTSWRYDEFLRLREGSTRMQVEAVLSDTAPVRLAAAESGAPSAGVAFVSGGFFAAAGGRVTAGRTLEAADEHHAGPPPVVVSHSFWHSRLNQDPAIVGRTIWVGRAAATIVGVAARDFSVPSGGRLWMPLTAYGAVFGSAPPTRAPDMGIEVFGRLLPGAAIAEAEAQLSGVAASLSGPAPAGESALRVQLDPHAGLGRAAASDTLAIALFVFAVIGLVLLLACANVASVLISTAITREREMGVRAALGAGRGRIVRQLVTESLALGAVAAAVGLIVASWAIPMIGRMIDAPAGTDLAPDLTVYLFLGIVTILTGVGAGLAPAWHGRGVDLLTPLKGGESASHNRVAPRRMRFLLVMTQAAVSVLLIVLAALFTRATYRAAAIDVGFDAAGLYAVSPGLGDPFAGDGAAITRFWVRAASELQAVPGIAAVALAEPPPFSGTTRTSITREEPARVVNLNGTSAEYFEAIGLRTLAGRTYTREEVAASAPVVVVSQSLARAYWPETSPLGELLPQAIPIPDSSARPTIVGVVSDAITARLQERSAFAVYEPLHRDSERFAQLLIRVNAGADGVIEAAAQRLRSIDPQAEVTISSVAARVQEEAGRPRMLAALSGIVGLIAIILCVIGLYGLTASVVGQRTREMGVRAALGAEPGDLLRLLIWDSLKPVVIGLAIGGGAALIAGRVVAAAMLFGVSPQDPIAFGGAAAILLAAATMAVLVPARRAAAVDAAGVLRRT